MPQHRSPRLSEALAAPGLTEVTDIIPFDEFGELGDLHDIASGAFDRDTEIIRAPELDDLLGAGRRAQERG